MENSNYCATTATTTAAASLVPRKYHRSVQFRVVKTCFMRFLINSSPSTLPLVVSLRRCCVCWLVWPGRLPLNRLNPVKRLRNCLPSIMFQPIKNDSCQRWWGGEGGAGGNAPPCHTFIYPLCHLAMVCIQSSTLEGVFLLGQEKTTTGYLLSVVNRESFTNLVNIACLCEIPTV